MKRYISYLAVAILMFAGCKPSDFEDVNTSQYALSKVSTRSLLTNSIQLLPQANFGISSYVFYSQYLSEGPYPGASRYNTINFDYSGNYIGQLFNLQAIIDVNSGKSVPGVNLESDANADGTPANQIAVARILKAYNFWWLTDRYGDLPYSEALKGIANKNPKYDTQESIYTDLFKELKEAEAQINVSGTLKGDILFNGDMAKWKIFANTTRMMMALRLKKNKPAIGQAEFNAAIASGVINSNADNIFYKYLAGDPNNYSPYYTNYTISSRNDYAISKTMTDYMGPKADPRLKVYADPLASGEVVGLPYGISLAPSIPGVYSPVGTYFRSAGSPGLILSYAQVLFAKAEMTLEGWLPGGDLQAAIYYADAIKASFQMYGVAGAADANYNTYMTNPDVVFNVATGLQQIMTEKWVHLYLNGMEAWTDWRRTGFPVLIPAAAAVQSGGIPLRHAYQTNENTINQKNYQEVIARQGPDNNYTKIWWLK